MSSTPIRAAPQQAHAVVVLNYHGRQDTLRCLESIFDTRRQALVYLVDNASSDGVIAEAESRWDRVVGIQLSENTGFSGGMNRGISRALSDGAQIVTILNNDTVVSPGMFDELEKIAQSGPYAVSPWITYLSHPEDVWFGGGTIDERIGLPRHLSALEISDDATEDVVKSEYLAGCCVTASRTVWERVGPLDDRYFLMFEDADWSRRARMLGVQLVVCKRAQLRHSVSASFKDSYSFLGYYYYVRNGLLYASERQRGDRIRFTLRFLRHRAIPSLADTYRQSDIELSLKKSIMLTAAIGSFAFKLYGKAPSPLANLAQRWATKKRG